MAVSFPKNLALTFITRAPLHERVSAYTLLLMSCGTKQVGKTWFGPLVPRGFLLLLIPFVAKKNFSRKNTLLFLRCVHRSTRWRTS